MRLIPWTLRSGSENQVIEVVWGTVAAKGGVNLVQTLPFALNLLRRIMHLPIGNNYLW